MKAFKISLYYVYRIRRNNRTCLNKRTPLPMRKVIKKKKKKKVFLQSLTLGLVLGLNLTLTLWLGFYFF